jgi:hypothetical protein
MRGKRREEEVIMVFAFSYPDYPTQKIDAEVVGGRP